MQQKHTLLALLFVVGGLVTSSAQRLRPVFGGPELRPATLQKTPALLPQDPLPAQEGPVLVTHSGVNYRAIEEIVGATTWDAQSYGALPPRIYANEKGEPVATWLFSLQASGQTDRGTARNVRANGLWSDPPSARVEANRTGFPAAVRLGDGTEVIVSHNTGQTPFKLWSARKASGATTWTEKAINGPTGIGMLWPTVAVGGANKNVLHMIAITTPVANVPGVIYEGMDGHPLYFRSKDGGLTWDKTAVILPGIDKSKFAGIQANNYAIDADGDNVAVVVFDSWNDLFILKSTDGGETWEKKQIFDFPDKLEKYDGNPAIEYDSTDLVYPSPVAGVPAINTNDGFGSLLVDPSGKAHLFVGRSIVVDTDFADTLTSYYPTASGIWYWNESFGQDSAQLIAGAFDYDGNGAINVSSGFPEIAFYGNNSLSSFPAVSLGKNGDIYLVYSATNEQYITDGKFYHTLYAQRSTNGGASWGNVIELTTKEYVDETYIGLLECVWPSMPKVTEDKLWVLYQQDYLPGCNIWGDSHPNDGSTINWFEVVADSLPPSPPVNSVFSPKGADPAFALKVSPNPASASAVLSASLRGDGPARAEVFDLLGNRVQELRFGFGEGRQSLSLPVSQLPAGTYFVRVTEGQRFGIEKFVKM